MPPKFKHSLAFVDAVFVRMHSIYGNIWDSRFKSTQLLVASRLEWQMELEQFSVNDIDFAVAGCKSRHELPPTLVQFIKLAKVARDRRTADHVALPRPPVNRQAVKRHINTLRAALKGGE